MANTLFFACDQGPFSMPDPGYTPISAMNPTFSFPAAAVFGALLYIATVRDIGGGNFRGQLIQGDFSGNSQVVIYSSTTLWDAEGMAVAPDGSYAIVCDPANNIVYKVTIPGGVASTLNNTLSNPNSAAFDGSGRLFIGIGGNLIGASSVKVVQLNPSTGAVLAATAELSGSYNYLDGMCYDSFTGKLYCVVNRIADLKDALLPVDPATLAVASDLVFNHATGSADEVCSDGTGNLFVGVFANSFSADGGIWQVPAGTAVFTQILAGGSSYTDIDALVSTVSAPVLTIVCGNPPAGLIGEPYSANASASGGTAPYTYAVVGGSLPPGLTLNASTGAIAGIPRNTGTFVYTLQVTDSLAATATVACSIPVTGFLAGANNPVARSASWILKKLAVGMKPDPHKPVRGSAQ